VGKEKLERKYRTIVKEERESGKGRLKRPKEEKQEGRQGPRQVMMAVSIK
jgi:hypothetical protein